MLTKDSSLPPATVLGEDHRFFIRAPADTADGAVVRNGAKKFPQTWMSPGPAPVMKNSDSAAAWGNLALYSARQAFKK